jgi:hypothetical protein
MARLRQNILGTYTGTLGEVSFLKNSDGTFMRRRPIRNKPATVSQSATRTRFLALQAVTKSLSNLTKETFSEDKSRIKPHNAFVRANKEVFTIQATYGERNKMESFFIEKDFSKLVVSSGSHFILETPTVSFDSVQRRVNFRWDFGEDSLGMADDRITALVYCPDLANPQFKHARRRDLEISFILSATFKDLECYAYIFASNDEKTKYSLSQYLGMVG